jgi:RimJ/RimL family protein N-acetyltransferase
MKNPFLIGAKIYLRPVEREESEVLEPWFNDPEVLRTVLGHRPLNRQQEEAYIEKINASEQDIMLGIAVQETDRLIGVTGLHQILLKNRSAGFGITIGAKDEWGKGYGTEATALMVRYAFETLNLNRVWLHVLEYNQRGLRTYEKLGFKREGVLRQEHYRDGRYWDTITMAILRQEWDQQGAGAKPESGEAQKQPSGR